MNILEVKNNLVKVGYEEDLGLSNLILIKDSTKSYIAQVIHLEASRVGKSAIAKIVFCYDTQIRAYDGTIPALKAETMLLDPSFLIKLLGSDDSLTLGRIAGSDETVSVNFDALNDTPIIISEKFYITKYLLNNLALQIKARGKKLVVFDTAGMFSTNKLTITKDFKLPLNCDTIDYICDKAFEDATPESRGMIQSIFEELSEYAKTVEFIPFDTFKTVVDSEFTRTKLMQLVILKNKLKQLRSLDIFAQTSADLGSIRSQIINNSIVVIDISKINSSLQCETIKYIYSVLKDIDEEIYAITPLSDDDRSILTSISKAENVHTTIVCDYSYAHLPELKKLSKDMFMFTPLRQQKDFGGYNIFLQKLAEDEFIAYGKMTKFIPLICKLYQLSGSDIKVPPQPEKPAVQIPEPQPEVQPEVQPEPIETFSETVEAEPETVAVTEEITTTEPVEEQITEPVEVPPAEQQEEVVSELGEPEITEPEVEVTEIEQPQTEEITQPVIEEETPTEEPAVTEEMISKMATGTVEEVINTQEPIAEPAEIAEAVQYEPVEPAQSEEVSELQQALDEVPELEEDEELSDDDLDMIEKMSTPNEEIPALNPEMATTPEVETPTEVAEDTTVEPIEPEAPAEEPTPTAESEPEPVANEPEEVVNTPPQTNEPLQTRSSSTPSVPEYSAEIPNEDKVNSDALKQGDKVMHDEFGEGVVEKMINYGDKILCSINFASVGRRLLNPEISELHKIG